MKLGFNRDLSLICMGMILIVIMVSIEIVFDYYIFIIITFMVSLLISFCLNRYWYLESQIAEEANNG